MISLYKNNSKYANAKLQCKKKFCKVQTRICRVQTRNGHIPNLNNRLRESILCKMQLVEGSCNPGINHYKSTTYTTNLDCTVNYSPYGRGASFRIGPTSPVHCLGTAICTTRQIFVGLPPHFFPSRPINPTHQKTNVSPDLQGNFFPSCLTDDTCDTSTPNKRISTQYSALCLDLGTTTGWALIHPGKFITSGSQNFRGSRFQGGGIRFLKFINFLDQLLTTTHKNIRVVCFEEVRRHLGVDAAHAYGGFVAQLTAWCEQHQIAYEGVPVGTIKRHATGRGNANKAQVVESVRQRGHQPIDDNEADALALAYWAIAHRLGG